MLTASYVRRPQAGCVQLGVTAQESMGTNMTALIAILGIAGAAMLIPVAHWLIKGD